MNRHNDRDRRPVTGEFSSEVNQALDTVAAAMREAMKVHEAAHAAVTEKKPMERARLRLVKTRRRSA